MTAGDLEHGWPEGLCIGRVSAVERDGKTCRIVVTPFVDANELDSVLLLDTAVVH
jgi:cell shape-determining protein MreC